MDDMCALDFTEQLLIFRDFGMIYARPEFVQANKVSYPNSTMYLRMCLSETLYSFLALI